MDGEPSENEYPNAAYASAYFSFQLYTHDMPSLNVLYKDRTFEWCHSTRDRSQKSTDEKFKEDCRLLDLFITELMGFDAAWHCWCLDGIIRGMEELQATMMVPFCLVWTIRDFSFLFQ
jgi:hypothetical protein